MVINVYKKKKDIKILYSRFSDPFRNPLVLHGDSMLISPLVIKPSKEHGG